MADGDYERRAGREAELKRLARILAEARKHATGAEQEKGNARTAESALRAP